MCIIMQCRLALIPCMLYLCSDKHTTVYKQGTVVLIQPSTLFTGKGPWCLWPIKEMPLPSCPSSNLSHWFLDAGINYQLQFIYSMLWPVSPYDILCISHLRFWYSSSNMDDKECFYIEENFECDIVTSIW